ncbi:MAG: site-specific integrase [Methyloceanibacter sp.]
MSVRKRSWVTSKGERRVAWVVDFRDSNGHRTIETFDLKKDADARRSEVDVARRDHGVTARSRSITINQLGEKWLAALKKRTLLPEGDDDYLQPATLDMYEDHVGHLKKCGGGRKLADLTVPILNTIMDCLRSQGHSADMVRRVRVTLGTMLQWAQDHLGTGRNMVREMGRKKRSKGGGSKPKLEIGKDIPTRAEVAKIINNARGRWRPLFLVAAYTGLRASELRGLTWVDVDLKGRKITVRQKADRYNKIGLPKSKSARRSVPFGKVVANTLTEWKPDDKPKIVSADQPQKLKCPKGKLNLVFPNKTGNIEVLSNIRQRGLMPACLAAGVTVPALDANGKPRRDKKGKPIVKAKYTGLHALRHFYASWCINRKVDGGLELPPKNVQERLGHSTITLTLDRYGHLFPVADHQEIDAAEIALMQAS